jgi:hypothetical protein
MDCTSTDEDIIRVFVPHGGVGGPAATDGTAGAPVADMDGAAGAPGRSVGNDQRRVFALAAEHGVQVRHLRPSIPTLEDVFAKALGEK